VRIKDLPSEARPRERLLSNGANSLSNTDLIAILLRTGVRGSSSVRLAEMLLARFQSLGALAHADLIELRQIKGIGPDKAIALKSAFTLAKRMAREIQPESPVIDSPERIAQLLRQELRDHQVESCYIVLLNSRNRLIRMDSISIGTLDSILIHPREVFRLAIIHQAASIVIVHNHPSGDPTPSESDIKVTLDLVRAGKILRISVVDHVILGLPNEQREIDYCSLRELGHISD
jgi:DNA repair protein RadC